LLQLIQNKFV